MEIDISKTLINKRMIYKTNLLELISGLFVNIIISLWFPFIGFILFYDAINGFGDNPSTGQTIFEIIISIVFLLIGFYIIRAYLLMNKLHILVGSSEVENRNIIRSILNHEKWNIQNDNKRFIKAVLPSALSFRRQLYLIFDKEKVFINSTSFGLHDMNSPFHFIADRKAVNHVKIAFEKKKNATSKTYNGKAG